MATIEARKNSRGKTTYRARVRTRGHPSQTASFERKTDAREWAAQTESAIKERRYFRTRESQRHTAGETIDKYISGILPSKKRNKDQKHHKTRLLWWKDEISEILIIP